MSTKYQDDLAHIRQMMEKSSRFISLSGLSGVFAGVVALVGAAYAFFVMQNAGINYFDGNRNNFTSNIKIELTIIAIVILMVAIILGYIFTAKKSKRKNLPMWDATSQRLLVTFAIPLIVGGLFCLALLYHNLFVLIAPTTLVFYGLALVSAERYTLSDIKYLGYCEIALGIASLFFLGWGFLLWVIGFGVLHIVYGIIMHKKYQ